MIVVTGGTGLLGAHLLYELLCAGATTKPSNVAVNMSPAMPI